MTKALKIYVAGKVSPNSVFGTHDWRDTFCRVLEEKTGLSLYNLDPTKTPKITEWDENDSTLVFGRDCFMISQADIVVVYLTDDISVGGSQEMLIAKYFQKPLVGFAARNGKFNKDEKEIGGRRYINWKCPFVSSTCDVVVENMDKVAEQVRYFSSNKTATSIKQITLIDEKIKEYKDKCYFKDKELHFGETRKC